MLRVAYDPGERVQWPLTNIPAKEGDARALTIEDRDVVRYSSGRFYVSYLYSELTDRLIEDMHSNIDAHFDNLIVISGPEGVGKSHLAAYICKSFDPEFNMERSYVYDWESFINSISGDDPQKVYWMDEAVNMASGRDWMKDVNKMLIKILQMMRSKGLTLVMCVPSFGSLDKYIREHRTRYLLIAKKMAWNKDSEPKRGYYELRVQMTEKERAYIAKNKRNPEAEDFFRSVGYGRFPKMDLDESKDYELVKAENQDKTLKEMRDYTEELTGKSKYTRQKDMNERLILYMTDVKGMSYQEIADAIGVPYNTIKGIAWRRRNAGDA